MLSESEGQSRRIPTLASYCQRVLSAHADALSCLGDDIRYDLIKPVLECCSAETLLRLEQSSPYLQENTSDLWERLCFKTYPLLVEQLARNGELRPESWREQFFLLREAEAHRLEEVSSKLRNQRMEAAERKKEREVKLTDRLPPAKRARTSVTQPKSLFQKAKNEVKFRKALYTTRILPPMVHGKTYRVLPSAPNAKPLMASSSRTPKICIGRTGATGPPSASTKLATSVPVSTEEPQLSAEPLPAEHSAPVSPLSTLSSLTPAEARTLKPPIQKKDPMASLFMPKHRAFSQLPKAASNTPAR
ncbi:RNA polymerase II transcription factor SIII subunit A-domain-containing protein [Pisolithus orientalis]|uniref:RNA polymerase II transcription factor SIII subunit A-domain-containing protein n=1 Tax=Pisolithus orientalis TaxID=936130 RepID=UPI0022244CDD|nr:RNA polymerase II transcription factor SIII subunit A-domain-containing protein [Pisolithus orientalis]KAI6028495.1 RNA polymerase II transcription factor SIII subunit A-domain-containing protein [Pisolithus orientalis]